MPYYRDLRAFLDALEARGKLYRFSEPIDKDSELLALMRVQLRGLPADERRVLLFDNVRGATGASYDMRVAAGVYGVSQAVLALGMGCASPTEMLERWHHALEHPVPPRLVDRGPVHEEVHVGAELLDNGLDELPAPVEEPGFSQALRTGVPMITADPETGEVNVGTYTAFFRDRARAVAGIGPPQHAMKHHWRKAKERGEDLPVAIVVGATPNVMLVGSAGIPYGVDELAVAGGLAGEPVELVPCRTVPLAVPAAAEIVIEGLISTRLVEPRLAFGEYAGYMNVEPDTRPVVQITAITHRQRALFTPLLVGFPPSDTNTITGFANAAMLYHSLRYTRGFPVADVYLPTLGGGADWCVVRLEADARVDARELLQAATTYWGGSQAKYLVVVDYDVDPRDSDLLLWALSYRVRPEVDIILQGGRAAGLDPAYAHAGPSVGGTYDGDRPPQKHRVLIDATMKGAYPPVALPRRDFMERALAIWQRHPALPAPRLRQPWHAYTLGAWGARDQALADLLVRGEYKAADSLADAGEIDG
jgi:4-hydroxy-3-polyprenylbenzoate decarboxylase